MTLRSSFLPLNEKLDARPVTRRSGIAASWFATSSARPSAIISCSGSPVRFVNGSTAMVCTAGCGARAQQRNGSRDNQRERGEAGDHPVASPEKADPSARRICAGERPQRLGEAGGIGVSAGRVLGQSFRNRVAQRARQCAALRCVRRPGRLVPRPDAAEQLVQHHAQRVNVAAQIERFATQQLRARIGGRQRVAPGLRQVTTRPHPRAAAAPRRNPAGAPLPVR